MASSSAAPGKEFSLGASRKAREALETSPDHRDSYDAQAFAEGIEQFAACSAVFEAGRPLTPRQKQEALVAYLRALLAKTAQPAKGIGLEQKTFTGLIQAAGELIAQSRAPGGLVVASPLLLLGQLADVAVFCSESGEQLENGLKQALRMHNQWDGVWAAPAAALESSLRAQGFDPLLTAAELRTLPLLLAGTAALRLAQTAQADGRQQRSRAMAAQAADAYRALVALHPSRPIHRLHHAMCLLMGPPSQRAAAVAELRDAFTQADASTDHWTAAAAAQNLVICLISGAEAAAWSVTEVQQVLQRGEHHQRLASAWLPPALGISKQLAKTQRHVKELSQRSRGAALLPAAGGMQMGAASSHARQMNRQECSNCKRWADKLKCCAQCRVTSYCSRECQKQHWPEHKGRCAELAAQQRDTGSSQQA